MKRPMGHGVREELWVRPSSEGKGQEEQESESHDVSGGAVKPRSRRKGPRDGAACLDSGSLALGFINRESEQTGMLVALISSQGCGEVA